MSGPRVTLRNAVLLGLLAACGGDPIGPVVGSLQLSISGLPVGTPAGDLFLFTMAANFAGYLNLLPCFRSDGIHLLAHARAARLSWATAATAPAA